MSAKIWIVEIMMRNWLVEMNVEIDTAMIMILLISDMVPITSERSD